MACNLNCVIAVEGRLKVTYIVRVMISRKRCNIDTLLLQTTGKYMAYRIVVILMTLSDLQGNSLIVSLFRWDFSWSCAAVDKISSDIARRAVPLR